MDAQTLDATDTGTGGGIQRLRSELGTLAAELPLASCSAYLVLSVLSKKPCPEPCLSFFNTPVWL